MILYILILILLVPTLMMIFAVPIFVCALAILIIKEVVVHFTAAYRVELAWIAKNGWWPSLALLCLMECDGCTIAACTWELACTTHRQWCMHFTRKINSSFTPPRRNQLRLPRSGSNGKYHNYA